MDARHADGSRERADQMVAALVQLNVDVIVTQGGAVLSAIRLAGTTPVVMGYSGDAVEAKFVESLARPGGTRTGVTFLALQLVGKRLEILAPLLPPRARIAVIADPQACVDARRRRFHQATGTLAGEPGGRSVQSQTEPGRLPCPTPSTH